MPTGGGDEPFRPFCLPAKRAKRLGKDLFVSRCVMRVGLREPCLGLAGMPAVTPAGLAVGLAAGRMIGTGVAKVFGATVGAGVGVAAARSLAPMALRAVVWCA